MSRFSISKGFDLLGRVFITGIFATAIPGKVTDFSVTADFIASKGIPGLLANVLLVCAIAFLVLGSLLFVFDQDTRRGASLLLIFLIPTTLIFHVFPPDTSLVRNLALIGVLILSVTRKA
ncbi:DoxX family protein [cyanobiont of Ornithocercus magnificus]|nr:DoxX family protein [cyanobiont of Ornithocercus magnificus]